MSMPVSLVSFFLPSFPLSGHIFVPSVYALPTACHCVQCQCRQCLGSTVVLPYLGRRLFRGLQRPCNAFRSSKRARYRQSKNSNKGKSPSQPRDSFSLCRSSSKQGNASLVARLHGYLVPERPKRDIR
ncbi:hypothetical protein LZ30DRAFT_726724 [Colletotrichum cereale]|nr:hypothetical protein LZ30DRAFT_726724 [Colletotrichum cereale]